MLCSPIYKYLRKKIKRNILIVGTKNSGKTSLLYRLVLNKFITTIPTIGFNLEKMKPNRQNKIGKNTHIYDFSDFMYVKNYNIFPKFDKIIFVIDPFYYNTESVLFNNNDTYRFISNKKNIESILSWLNIFLEYQNYHVSERNIEVLFAISKNDMLIIEDDNEIDFRTDINLISKEGLKLIDFKNDVENFLNNEKFKFNWKVVSFSSKNNEIEQIKDYIIN